MVGGGIWPLIRMDRDGYSSDKPLMYTSNVDIESTLGVGRENSIVIIKLNVISIYMVEDVNV